MSLFTRIIGTSGEKIGVHDAQSLIGEMSSLRQTRDDVIENLGLEGQEIADLDLFILKSNQATNKHLFSSRIFNYLYLGERGYKAGRDYTDETLFWQMIDSELGI